MFIKLSKIKRKFRKIALKLFHSIENNNNCDFETNGEKLFLNNLSYLLQKSNEIKTIFDVGANIGDYSDIIKKNFESKKVTFKLHLFEPTRDCFIELKKKFLDNNIVLNNFGASNQNTVSKIFYDNKKSGLTSLYQRNLSFYKIKLDQSERIKLMRLDKYIEEKNIMHINFIKIDVEGHEVKVLEGLGNYLNKEFIDFIQFEYGGCNLDSKTSLMEIYNLLTNKGFKIAKILQKGLYLRNYNPDLENYVYSNYVAVSRKILE